MNFLITAGPTREPIDPVRYISNRSSGKMGYALAQAAREAGHDVALISGPVSLSAPPGVTLVKVTTAQEMDEAVHAHLGGIDMAILAAAVADSTPATRADHKIKKREGIPQIVLKPTRDILASLGHLEERPFLLAGFAAETNDIENNAREKLDKKKCDFIVANDVSKTGAGFDSDENEVILFYKDKAPTRIPQAGKLTIARELIAIFTNTFMKSCFKQRFH